MSVDVVCFGELLIDFVSTQRGVAVGDALSFTKAPGGAPANVAVGLAKLGVSSAFMGQLGDDFFGHYLAGVLREQGVNLAGLRFSDQAMTPLAFVSVDAEGERSFVFYRKPSADMLMTPADLNLDLIDGAKIFHYGSITLIDEPLRGTTLAAIERAQAGGLLISYDPNLRLALWPNAEAAKTGLLLGLEYAHIVKLSEEELDFLSGINDLDAGVKALWRGATRLMIVTQGEAGCTAFSREKSWSVPSFSVDVEDTIGAGDGFVAGLLSGLLALGDDWPKQDLTSVLRRANAIGALTTTQQGGILALPDTETVAAFLAANSS